MRRPSLRGAERGGLFTLMWRVLLLALLHTLWRVAWLVWHFCRLLGYNRHSAWLRTYCLDISFQRNNPTRSLDFQYFES